MSSKQALSPEHLPSLKQKHSELDEEEEEFGSGQEQRKV